MPEEAPEEVVEDDLADAREGAGPRPMSPPAS
jgi:hypothetical protein